MMQKLKAVIRDAEVDANQAGLLLSGFCMTLAILAGFAASLAAPSDIARKTIHIGLTLSSIPAISLSTSPLNAAAPWLLSLALLVAALLFPKMPLLAQLRASISEWRGSTPFATLSFDVGMTAISCVAFVSPALAVVGGGAMIGEQDAATAASDVRRLQQIRTATPCGLLQVTAWRGSPAGCGCHAAACTTRCTHCPRSLACWRTAAPCG